MRRLGAVLTGAVFATALTGVAHARSVPPPPGVTSDVNGDGLTDAVLGVNGTAYVVLGHRGHPTTLKTVKITGGTSFQGANAAVAGDVNGDGLGDVAIDGPTDVVFGRKAPKAVDVRTLGSAGFHVTGGSADGSLLLPAGDVNGDGLADLLFIARADGAPTRYAIVLGARSGADVDAAVDGPRVLGLDVAGDVGITAAGDLNGDGRADLLTPDAEYLGAKSGPPVRKALTGDTSGTSLDVTAAGDVDGDGVPDFVQSAACTRDDFSCPGHFFLLFGAKGSLVDPLQVNWPAARTLRVNAAGKGVESDPADFLAPVGDVSRDGRADVYSAPAYGTGIVVGLAKRRSGSAKVSAVARWRIKRVHAPVVKKGTTFLQGAPWASGPGDLNGDGTGDLALVAPPNDQLNASKGEALAWVVWGRKSGTVTLDRLGRDGVVIAGRPK